LPVLTLAGNPATLEGYVATMSEQLTSGEAPPAVGPSPNRRFWFWTLVGFPVPSALILILAGTMLDPAGSANPPWQIPTLLCVVTELVFLYRSVLREAGRHQRWLGACAGVLVSAAVIGAVYAAFLVTVLTACAASGCDLS